MHAFPAYLFIGIKRFVFDRNAGVARKLDTVVTLDQLPYVCGVQYRLRSIVSHDGQFDNSGHYYCDRKNDDGTWTHCEDSQLKAIEERDVMEDTLKKGYLLVFEKI